MAEDDPTHPRHRLTVQDDDVAVIAKADGRVWRVNWPAPGQITVEHPGGRVEVLELQAFLAREERSGQV